MIILITHLTLVKLRHSPEKVECPDIPNLRRSSGGKKPCNGKQEKERVEEEQKQEQTSVLLIISRP